MQKRIVLLLIGPVLAVLLVLIALEIPWQTTKSAPAAAPRPPSATPAPTAPPVVGADGIGDPYFPRAGNGGYDVTAYDIGVRYDPPTDQLVGHTTITATTTESLSRFDLDLRLPASAVTVDDRPAVIHQDGSELQVTPAAPVPSGAPMTVRVDYAGMPSSVSGGSGKQSPWVRTVDGAVAVGEPDIAAWWYPSNDHPSDKATFTITAIVPAGLQVISNGALLGGPEPAGAGLQQWRWQETEPMATYLAFIAIGNYDIVRRDTRFGLYLAAYDQALDPVIAAAARASVEQTPQIIEFLSGIFGPYPFRQLGGVVPDANLGFALEDQTRPVYASTFFDAGQNVTVVVHELAHQWFGDSVSVSHWSDIWLNEGFATYAEWLYTEHNGGPSTQQSAAQSYARHPAGDEFWQTPPGAPGALGVFNNAVYSRGGMALQAIRDAVGDQNFFAALRAWATERAGGNGSVQDFLALVKHVSGKNVDAIAQSWLFAPTRPPAPPS
ncbi:MAG: peptidase [Pseudonocardiales bacterium]|nr:M1 family metallopeptidase [Actinomycetota bacterium]PZS22613.1 MAG: peptidase [Pseudonocardiales bacterium]